MQCAEGENVSLILQQKPKKYIKQLSWNRSCINISQKILSLCAWSNSRFFALS